MYKIHENGIESECGKYVLENLEECLEELNHLLKERNELEMDLLCADERRGWNPFLPISELNNKQ